MRTTLIWLCGLLLCVVACPGVGADDKVRFLRGKVTENLDHEYASLSEENR